MYTPEPPTLYGIVVNRSDLPYGYIAVWCPWCSDWHQHGLGGKAPSATGFYGHRTAHCDPTRRTHGYELPSPMERSGYYLQAVGTASKFPTGRPSWARPLAEIAAHQVELRRHADDLRRQYKRRPRSPEQQAEISAADIAWLTEPFHPRYTTKELA